jgi:hypothetical protein
MKRVSNGIKLGWRRRLAAAVALGLVTVCAFFVAGAFGDAGNPILGTIQGTLVTNPDGTVTVYVRGQWNWYSHNSDCNTDRAGAGVGIIWNDPTEPGYTVSGKTPPNIAIAGSPNGATESGSTVTLAAKNAGGFSTLAVGNTIKVGGVKPAGYNGTFAVTAIGSGGDTLQYTDSVTGLANGGGGNVTPPAPSADVGISSLRSGDTVNSVDRMVHPSDIGNAAEGYPGFTGQTFNDPSPPDPNSYLSWKGGCGREPLTATASPGPGGGEHPSNTPCADGTTQCSGHPWGSWGYQPALNDGTGQGYKHTYAKRSDVTTVCVNFYDVHGGGTGNKLQLVNGAKEITVDGNGDNSIQTNAFNTSQGANCITFAGPSAPTITTKASDPVTIGDPISDTATLSGASNPTGTITFKAYAPNSDGSADTSCSTPVKTLTVPVDHGNGDYQSGPFTPSGTAPEIAGTYEWTASYSGDPNNASASTSCGDEGEQSVVNKHGSTVPTAQTVVLADFAKVSDSSGTPTGTVTFQLFTSSDCSGTPLYDSGPVQLVNGLAQTTSSDNLTLTSNGTYKWLVSYSGDANFAPSSSACGTEQTTISGNSPGIVP